MQFQSTLPLRGATVRNQAPTHHKEISIHAPLTGSDMLMIFSPGASTDFNPRSPYGERHGKPCTLSCWCAFQSTLPLRGATKLADAIDGKRKISIHAPLTGSDQHQRKSTYFTGHFNPRSPYGERRCGDPNPEGIKYFNPRSPYGERPLPRHCSICGSTFQSTLPLRGATNFFNADKVDYLISIHAPLTGSDEFVQDFIFLDGVFQSTLPLRGATS